MEYQKAITKIIGVGQVGFKLCDYIKNNSCECSDGEILKYTNIESKADNEKLNVELSDCDSVVIILDAMQEFEFAKKIASVSKSKNILTIVVLINGTTVQQNELVSVSDSVVELNMNDKNDNFSEMMLHFAENVSLNRVGLIGIDWYDVQSMFRNSGKAYVYESIAEDVITNKIFQTLPTKIDCTTVKSAFIYIRLSEKQSLDYMDEIIESVSGKLNPEAEVLVNGVWGDFQKSCVNVTFVGV